MEWFEWLETLRSANQLEGFFFAKLNNNLNKSKL